MLEMKIRKLIDKEMKCLCYLGIFKEGFSLYSSPVMLISWKIMQDKRIGTNFRHLNVRILKNNLAYPLVRDTFSKCEVLLVLDLKDAFHSLWLSEDSRRYCGIITYFIFISKNAYGIEPVSPFNLAILYKCNFRMLTKQIALQNNYG